ncbi:MAG: hypothetical protein H6Q89_2958 [Myxococcaceae bacterium]|nr:hypothetical protein [Myxococcaceae bacterium]
MRLPTLDKAEAAKHRARLLSPAARSGTGVVSSGTTRAEGPLLLVPTSDAELEASAAFSATWEDWTPTVSHAVARGLALEVRTMLHGVPDGPPAGDRLRMPWTYTPVAFRQFSQLLHDSHRGKRITSLVIGAAALRPLTAWLLEHDVDPSRLKVRMIGTNGFRLSDFWRRWLAAVWRAELWDNFSLSEFSTASLECPDCGHHHWLAPPLLHEVLDLVSQEPLERGLGELTLTGLHPFVQAMPLIRYRTGDLVEIGPRCPRAGARGFKPRGRIRHSLLEGNRLLVSGQDVVEVLDAEGAVARHPHPVETLGLVQTRDLGAVKYRLQREGRAAVLEVELRFDPMVFREEAAALVERIWRRLGCSTLKVRAVRPGSLTAPWSKF